MDKAVLFDFFTFWGWLALGMGLLVFELLAPGVFFLWLAIAAGITGLAVLVLPGLSWEGQLVLFGLLSVVSVVLGNLLRKRTPLSDHPTLNRRGEQYVGRHFTLDAPVVNGQGKLKVDDTTWKVMGPDLPAGTTVVVTGVDGTQLRIDRVAEG